MEIYVLENVYVMYNYINVSSNEKKRVFFCYLTDCMAKNQTRAVMTSVRIWPKHLSMETTIVVESFAILKIFLNRIVIAWEHFA